ncbi:uncharacterized protein K452DRAFT_291796 [Aplosporella prunicola CBS 121167]|uniref:Transaldolase n=1 Tax=Aplosporella prunicola CBS 121167 TaxID=1176127 RepID=A0A6A6B1P1_9PEZI|nr:uncharacterized protein K452DRAFT_291796 [Aplosporella prunicola CBS 121167]KAF2137144.1 hypothetical protein K452DRAFT_291796 [Aplosporella prunicola CBS 121167]
MSASSEPLHSLLDLLRARSTVDCDTLDAAVAHERGPFADCTSNQAIACAELQEHRHKELLQRAATLAKELHPKYSDVELKTLAVEIGMILLVLQIAPHLTGFVHIQANPFDSYNAARTVAGAQRIVALFRAVEPRFDTSRVCIKIASTWEGLQACRALQAAGIETLATTLFTLEQAALAAEAGCRYVAPYVNELKVHFDKSYCDPAPNLALCVQTQRYLQHHSYRTAVLPASLTNITECLSLAGVAHITVPPALLRELASTPALDPSAFPSLFDDAKLAKLGMPEKLACVREESAWRMAFTRSGKGVQEKKIVQAINIFCDMQGKLEEVMGAVLGGS